MTTVVSGSVLTGNERSESMKALMLLVLDGSLLLLSGFALFSAFRFLDKGDKPEKVFFCTIAGFCLAVAIVATKVIMSD